MYSQPATWQAAQKAVTEHLNSYSGDGTLEALSTYALWFDEFFRLNAPDFWFVHLPLLGFSPLVVSLLALALLGLLRLESLVDAEMSEAAVFNSKSKNPKSFLVPALIIILSAIYKLFLLALNAVPFNGDEAIVALMARHILRGERPIFFYGQAYLGSTDAWLVAVSFSIFGETVFAIRLVHIFLFAGVVFTTNYVSVAESQPGATLTVRRGDDLGLPFTVDYATVEVLVDPRLVGSYDTDGEVWDVQVVGRS